MTVRAVRSQVDTIVDGPRCTLPSNTGRAHDSYDSFDPYEASDLQAHTYQRQSDSSPNFAFPPIPTFPPVPQTPTAQPSRPYDVPPAPESMPVPMAAFHAMGVRERTESPFERLQQRSTGTGSVMPVVMPHATQPPDPLQRRRRGLVAVVLSVAVACAIIALAMMPKPGALVVRLRTPDGKPAAHAAIFVDGQRVCDTDPCKVHELSAGNKTVKVIAQGQAQPQVARVEIIAGEQQVLWIALEKSAPRCVE